MSVQTWPAARNHCSIRTSDRALLHCVTHLKWKTKMAVWALGTTLLPITKWHLDRHRLFEWPVVPLVDKPSSSASMPRSPLSAAAAHAQTVWQAIHSKQGQPLIQSLILICGRDSPPKTSASDLFSSNTSRFFPNSGPFIQVTGLRWQNSPVISSGFISAASSRENWGEAGPCRNP